MSVLADWLVRRAPAWLDGSRPVAPAPRRALLAIERCRTPALGGCVYRCTGCDETDFAYHSCHHRACPRCGGNRTAAWTARQEARLLPVGYFLVTFTVPQELRGACAARPELLHDLLFAQSAAALQTVAAHPRHLGGELGMIGVLHTWGRQLQHHPHVHYIVPGGALSADRQRWRPARAGGTWLLPGAAVAVWRAGWWVHTQPAGSGASVVRYLARYVHRTAISDERIVSADDQAVTFRYTDTASQQRQECTLSADEFMRRYLQHVLPAGQHRVRYFGWLHPAARARRLIVETLLAVVIVVRPKTVALPPWHLRCPHCGGFTLVAVERLPRSTGSGQARGPPVCAR